MICLHARIYILNFKMNQFKFLAVMRRFIKRFWLRIVSILVLMFACGAVAWADTPIIAAAADLTFALEKISEKFTQDTGHKVRLVFGSSGNFYRQITEGAPFQMFLSADEEFVFKLNEAGKAEGRGDLYAIGRLALIVPNGSPLKLDGEFRDVAQRLKDPRVKKFAIANPQHAPYGKRAVEALQNTDVWEVVRDKLVMGENVAQAAQFAVSGNTQGGIIAYSMALSPAVAQNSRFILIPESLHMPLRQRMVLVKGAGQTARAFYQYMQQPQARAIMKQYGFGLNP